MKHVELKFTQNNNNLLYEYIKENINKTPLIFFKNNDVTYAIEIIKYLLPYKSANIIVDKKEYVKICLDNFPYLTKNEFKKKFYVNHTDQNYFLQSDNSNFVLTENYFTITLN